MVEPRQFRGVFLRPDSGKFRAVADIFGQRTILGDFDHPIDAAIAYDAVASLTDRERNFPAGIISREFMALARQKIREAKKKLPRKKVLMTSAQKRDREAKRQATIRIRDLELLGRNNATLHAAGRPELPGIDVSWPYRKISDKLGIMPTEEHWRITLADFGTTDFRDRDVYMRAFARQCQRIWDRRRKRDDAAAASVADSTSKEPSECSEASDRELSRPLTLAEAMQLAQSF